MTGTGCPGKKVEYDVRPNNGRVNAFRTVGEFDVRPDGTWEGQVQFSEALDPGKVGVTARCLAGVAEGDPLYIYYGDRRKITVLRASDAVNSGITSTTTTSTPRVTAPPDTSGR